MPFGVTGSSPVVSAIQDKDPDALDLKNYSSEADLIQAAEQGDIYGGYIPGKSADTLVTVPAKSFFGEIYVRGAFTDAAKKSGRAMTTTTIAPLPTSDRTGAVVGLLLLPTLIGGYLIATLLFAFTQSAAVPGRIAIILGFSVAVALITGAAAGLTGAVPLSDVWPLLPCFALVTASVALAGVSDPTASQGIRHAADRAVLHRHRRRQQQAASGSRSCRATGRPSEHCSRHAMPWSSSATCATSAVTTS